jgi:hypothetical protein
MPCHGPIRNIGVVERRLKRLVFDEGPLLRIELRLELRQVQLEPLLALPEIRRAGMIGAVREPKRDIPRSCRTGNTSITRLVEGAS